MPHPCPHHCPKPGGGGTAALAGLVLAAVVIAAIARPVERLAVDVAEIAIITVASVIGLAVLGAAAYVALRARGRRQNRLTAVAFHPPVTRRGSQAVSASRRRAIEPARPVLYVIRSEHPEEDPCSPPSSS